ncbi:hypothetical protein G4G27_12605 [Sphingomonas sp. So64.6b]|uniref:hypothetical protein n=1 Tax=Sphingomonas sp. So64.6b TaxID=2997354 RepID=UPI001603D35B|nr:hypothetical protein [Sphingomonas sp. So64.6b]QNA84738.1 hypothetical protein G4G27_12605 [Sphingomonas sp. So64.6b]
MQIVQLTAITSLLTLTACGPQPPAAPAVETNSTLGANELGCALPTKGWVKISGVSPRSTGVGEKNIIELDIDNHLSWNEAPINQSAFETYVHAVATIEPQPLTVLRTDRRIGCDKLRNAISVINAAISAARPPAYSN